MWKFASSLLALAVLCCAQTPGTVTAVTTATITATVPAFRCTIATSNSGASVSMYCYVNNSLAFNASTTVGTAADKAQGSVVSYGYAGDSVAAAFWRPAGGAVQWQVSANGTMKQGSF